MQFSDLNSVSNISATVDTVSVYIHGTSASGGLILSHFKFCSVTDKLLLIFLIL